MPRAWGQWLQNTPQTIEDITLVKAVEMVVHDSSVVGSGGILFIVREGLDVSSKCMLLASQLGVLLPKKSHVTGHCLATEKTHIMASIV